MVLVFLRFDLIDSLAYYSLVLCTGHPWLVNHHDDMRIPLDMIIHKLVKAYICSSSLRKSALRVCGTGLILLWFWIFYWYKFPMVLSNHALPHVKLVYDKTTTWKLNKFSINDFRLNVSY